MSWPFWPFCSSGMVHQRISVRTTAPNLLQSPFATGFARSGSLDQHDTVRVLFCLSRTACRVVANSIISTISIIGARSMVLHNSVRRASALCVRSVRSCCGTSRKLWTIRARADRCYSPYTSTHAYERDEFSDQKAQTHLIGILLQEFRTVRADPRRCSRSLLFSVPDSKLI